MLEIQVIFETDQKRTLRLAFCGSIAGLFRPSLEEFCKTRNFIAHNVIAACMDDDGELDGELIAAQSFTVLISRLRGRDLVDEIAVEHSKLFTIEDNIPMPPDAV